MLHYKSILISSLFIFSLALSNPAYADFANAKKAYDSGDFKTAHAEFLIEADGGNAEAQFYVGYMYMQKQGVKRKRDEAARYYQLAVDQGHPQAHLALAKMYYDGKGVKKNREKAAQMYQKMADQGNAGAQTELGKLYERGRGVAKDKAEAERLYRIAAEQGFHDGQYQLATLLLKKPGFGSTSFSQGIFENSNYKYKTKGNDAAHVEGYAWYKKSMDRTTTRTQKMNFRFTQEGIRTITLLRGERLFNEWMGHKEIIDLNDQADQGYTGAQIALANRHAKGDGAIRNVFIAYHWYNLAYVNGLERAKKGRDNMCRRMKSIKDVVVKINFDYIRYLEIEYLEAHPNAFNGKIRPIINNLCS